jgi:hypothetical protein
VAARARFRSSYFFVFFSRLLYLTKNFDVVCIFSSRSVFFVFFAMARSGLGQKKGLFASPRETTGACSCVPCRGHDRARALSLTRKITNSSLAREGSG